MAKYTIVEHIIYPPTHLNYKYLIKSLGNKTILITGASSGIGECLSYCLENYNVHLILVARSKDKLSRMKYAIEKYKAKVSIYPIDLRDFDEVDKYILYLNEIDYGIDYFINNAGKSIMRSIYNSLNRFHDFQRTMSINYFAPVHLMLSLIPLLEKTSGHVINISTVNVLIIPFPYWAAYQSSKSAFDNWFRCVAPELRLNGITSSSLYLPLIKTPMIEPNKFYNNKPAMSPYHAAKIILKFMYSKNNSYKPWWLIFLQLLSIVFRQPLEHIILNIFKKAEHK